MRLILAVRILFATLFSREIAQQVRAMLAGSQTAAPQPSPAPSSAQAAAPRPQPVVRSEALTLLGALQREARFVDLVQEPLSQYSDAQIGAAARDVLRDCGRVLERLFAVQPIMQEAEGAEVEVPAGVDVARVRVTGASAGSPPLRGRVVHHGWEATRCEMPSWSGSAVGARVVAAAEVERMA